MPRLIVRLRRALLDVAAPTAAKGHRSQRSPAFRGRLYATATAHCSSAWLADRGQNKAEGLSSQLYSRAANRAYSSSSAGPGLGRLRKSANAVRASA